MPEVLFIADQVSPLRGMERALVDAVSTLQGHLGIRVVALTGPTTPALTAPVALLDLPAGPARLALAIPRLRRTVLRETRPDTVVVSVGVWAAIPVVLAALTRSRPPVVVWEHSLLPWRYEHSRGVRLAARLVYRVLGRRVAAVVAVSPAVGRTVAELAPPRTPVIVVPNVVPAVPAVAATDRRPPERPGVRLLGVGGLVPLKNWDLAIDSLVALPEDHSLVIAGEGGARAALQRRIEERGLGHRVTLLGHRDDVPDLLASADVVVHPSSVETFGYTLAEAAAAGKPLVCLDAPVMNELIPGTYRGRLSADASPEAFAAAIRQAVLDGPDPGHRGRPANTDEVREAWLTVLSQASRTSVPEGG